MEQEEKYEEFIDKYNRIIKENDVHKIKKPENYEELKYTSEEKQNYMIAMLKIYRIFSDEMYKLYQYPLHLLLILSYHYNIFFRFYEHKYYYIR